MKLQIFDEPICRLHIERVWTDEHGARFYDSHSEMTRFILHDSGELVLGAELETGERMPMSMWLEFMHDNVDEILLSHVTPI